MPRYTIPITISINLPNDFAAKIVKGMITAGVAKAMSDGLTEQPMMKDAAIEVVVGDPEETIG